MSGLMNNICLPDLLVNLREKHGSDFVSISDLQHPTSDFTMNYFAIVLGQLGIDIEGMSNCESVDIFRDINAFIQVYMAVKKVCPVPKYFAHFNVLTLIEPKPEDIIYVAAMDNFYDFFFQRATDQLQPRLQELDSLQQLLQEQLNRKTELQHQLNDRAAARSKRVMEQAQAEREIEELGGELRDLRLQKKLLEEEAAEQQKALKELLLEVDSNRNRWEQLKELQEAQVELKALKEELQQLHNRLAVQDKELAEKHSALQEKASRKRFLEECIALESQATESAAELVEVASQVEKQHASLLEGRTKAEHILRELDAVMKKKTQFEDRKAALEEDIAVQEKIIADSEKERKDLERNIQDVEEVKIVKHQQNIISLENKIKDVKTPIQKRKGEMLLMNEMFEKEKNKLYEKAHSIKKELIAALES